MNELYNVHRLVLVINVKIMLKIYMGYTKSHDITKTLTNWIDFFYIPSTYHWQNSNIKT